MASFIKEYISETGSFDLSDACLAYLSNLQLVASVCNETAASIVDELADQRANIKLIGSENYCSFACQAAMGNLLTDKYAEGYPGHRFYAGCDNVDKIEALACQRARDLFTPLDHENAGDSTAADHAYVQPHSGADANMVAFWAILMKKVGDQRIDELNEKGELQGKNLNQLSEAQWQDLRKTLGNQRLLGMRLEDGGHLTHGFRLNVSAKMFESHSYGVDPSNGQINYDELQKTANEVKPLILLAGFSAYPRKIDFRRMREIADSVGAVLMVDMAHFAGLVAGRAFQAEFNPIVHADVVTTTTHKTLRGPRGGMVLCRSEFADHVDKGCPYVIGGPLPHVMAAKSVCFKEALAPEFSDYARQIIENSQALAKAFIDEGQTVATGGTENHLVLVDVKKPNSQNEFHLNGRQAESALREVGITLNRNTIPKEGERDHPWYPSGLRLGTPAVTTLGMGPEQMREIASIVSFVLKNTLPLSNKAKYEIADAARQEAQQRVATLINAFPVYPELDLDVLRKLTNELEAAAH